MSSSKLSHSFAGLVAAAALVVTTGAAWAANEKLMIPVGHAQVISQDASVKTVAIAEPKIADAAVGSERTVIVNAKALGATSLVVYGEAGRFKVYDIEVFEPSADKQVALHVRVAEVNENAKRELGFDLTAGGRIVSGDKTNFLTGGLFTTKVASPSIPLGIGPKTDGAFAIDHNNGEFVLAATWRALQEKGDLRVLANPTLVARSGEKASFLAGGEFPIPIASNAGTVAPGGVSAITVTIEWKEFGVKVDFTPNVLSDGSMDLEVMTEVSQLDFTNPLVLSGFTLPIIQTRRTSTTVHMEPNEHLVIGGLKQKDRTKVVKKVPILGEIPIVNMFFSTTRTETLEKELLVVVSPEMVAGRGQLPKLPTDAPVKN